VDYCTADLLDRATRGRINFPLDLRGVTVRDRVVVTVIRARSGSMAWIVRESEADQASAARAAANGASGRLTLDRASTPGEWDCPCDCHEIESTCGRLCDRQLSAFTCAPVLGVCSAACTCK
jgi:hypothetical protein